MNKMGQYNDKNQYQPWQGKTWKQLIISAIHTDSFLVAENTVERKLSNFKEKSMNNLMKCKAVVSINRML